MTKLIIQRAGADCLTLRGSQKVAQLEAECRSDDGPIALHPSCSISAPWPACCYGILHVLRLTSLISLFPSISSPVQFWRGHVDSSDFLQTPVGLGSTICIYSIGRRHQVHGPYKARKTLWSSSAKAAAGETQDLIHL